MRTQAGGREEELSHAPALSQGRAEGQADRAAALGDFAERCHRKLVGYLRQRTGSREEAQDIAQGAYLKFLEIRHEGVIEFLPDYVWRSAFNLATNEGRRRVVRERYAHELALAGVASSPSAEVIVAARQCLEVIERSINELPEKCRRAFELRVLEGWSFLEVAREMGLCDRMVKFYVARALAFLRSRVETAEGLGGRFAAAEIEGMPFGREALHLHTARMRSRNELAGSGVKPIAKPRDHRPSERPHAA